MPLYAKASVEDDGEPASAALGFFLHESRRLTPEKARTGEQSPELVFSTPQKWHQSFLHELLRPDDWSAPQGRVFPFKPADILRLCDAVEAKLREEPALLEVHAPVKVIGDIHGQFGDLMHLFKVYGAPSRLGDIGFLDYMFLGDYVDRGEWSLETVCLLFALKTEFPGQVHLLRGNHETMAINAKYGFLAECKGRLGPVEGWQVWHRVNEVFFWLPLAARIDGKILCLHGGLSEQLDSVEQIAAISRPLSFVEDSTEARLANQLLWNDPNESDAVLGSHASIRGHDAQTFSAQQVEEFCQGNGLDLIVRAHQCVRDGFERFARGRLITVFSAANYCGRYDNAGALLLVGRDHVVVPKVIRPQPRNPRVFEARVQFSQLSSSGGRGGLQEAAAAGAGRKEAEQADRASPQQQQGRPFVRMSGAPWCEVPSHSPSPSPQHAGQLPAAAWQQSGEFAAVPDTGRSLSPPLGSRRAEPAWQHSRGQAAAAPGAAQEAGTGLGQSNVLPTPCQSSQAPGAGWQQSSAAAGLEHARSLSPPRPPRQASKAPRQLHGCSPSPPRLPRRQAGAPAGMPGSMALVLRDAQRQIVALPSMHPPREDVGELLQRVATSSPAAALVQRSAGSTGSVGSGRIPASTAAAGAVRLAQRQWQLGAPQGKQQLESGKRRLLLQPWAAATKVPVEPGPGPAAQGTGGPAESVGCWRMQAAAAAGLARVKAAAVSKLRVAKAAAQSQLQVAKAAAVAGCAHAKAGFRVVAAAVASAPAKYLGLPTEPPLASAAGAAAGALGSGMAPLAEGIMWANAAWECWAPGEGEFAVEQQPATRPVDPSVAGVREGSMLVPALPGPSRPHSVMETSPAATVDGGGGCSEAQPSGATGGEEAGGEEQLQETEAHAGAGAEGGSSQDAEQPPPVEACCRRAAGHSTHPLIYSAGVLLSVGAVFLSKLSAQS